MISGAPSGALPAITGGSRPSGNVTPREQLMNSIIWLVGAVVIVLFVLGFFGLR